MVQIKHSHFAASPARQELYFLMNPIEVKHETYPQCIFNNSESKLLSTISNNTI